MKSIPTGRVALDRTANDKCLDCGPLVSTQPDLSVALRIVGLLGFHEVSTAGLAIA